MQFLNKIFGKYKETKYIIGNKEFTKSTLSNIYNIFHNSIKSRDKKCVSVEDGIRKKYYKGKLVNGGIWDSLYGINCRIKEGLNKNGHKLDVNWTRKQKDIFWEMYFKIYKQS